MGRDFLDGDHSFKNWFNIMWKNGYIQYFVLFLSLFIGELANFNWVVDIIEGAFTDGVAAGIMTSFAVFLPPGAAILVAYKGLWQFWNDLKHGRSR